MVDPLVTALVLGSWVGWKLCIWPRMEALLYQGAPPHPERRFRAGAEPPPPRRRS
jgi:hypothetical protein